MTKYRNLYYDTEEGKKYLYHKNVKRGISLVLSSVIIFNGIILPIYKINKLNPFKDCNIKSSSFCSDYKAARTESYLKTVEFKEALDMIKNADIETKKAYILWDGIIHNDNLSSKDIENIKGYIQYFIDNKYLNYEYVYNQLSTIKLIVDSKTSSNASYDRENNTMVFESDSSRDKCIGHEFAHSEDYSGSILNGNNYVWLIEGLNSILNYEYNNATTDAWDIKAYFIRILCELIDSDVFFKVRATGNVDLIINELENKGLSKTQINELFDIVNNFNKTYFIEKKQLKEDINPIKIQLIDKLREAYNVIYKDQTVVKPIYYAYLNRIASFPHDRTNIIENFYYFNTLKKSENLTNNMVINDKINLTNSKLSEDGTIYNYTRQIERKVIIEYYDTHQITNIYQENKNVDSSKRVITFAEFNESIDGTISYLSESSKVY